LIDNKGNQIHADFQYYCVLITGRIELDFERMGVYVKNQCSVCGAVDYDKETWEWDSVFTKEGTHDGSDLFVAKHFEAAPICTKGLLEVVYKEKLTNFQFRPFDSMFSCFNTPPAIDLKDLFKNTH